MLIFSCRHHSLVYSRSRLVALGYQLAHSLLLTLASVCCLPDHRGYCRCMNYIQYFPEQDLSTCIDMRHHTSNPVDNRTLCPPISVVRNPGTNFYGRLGMAYTAPDGFGAISLDASSVVSFQPQPFACSAGQPAPLLPVIIGAVCGSVVVAAVAGAVAYVLHKRHLVRLAACKVTPFMNG